MEPVAIGSSNVDALDVVCGILAIASVWIMSSLHFVAYHFKVQVV